MLLMKQNNTSRECNCIQAKESIVMSKKSYKIRLGKVCREKNQFFFKTVLKY